MANISIVVQAQYSHAYPTTKEGEYKLEVGRGQQGIFVWTPKAENANLLIATVIWDYDPYRLPRESPLALIEAIGVEINGIRLTGGF